MESKPRICFEVEKVIGVSSDGSYQVQWAPAWVSKYHLVGCEHLIQEFLQQQEQEQQPQQRRRQQQQQEKHQKQQQKQHQKQQQEQQYEQKSHGEYMQYFEDNEEDVSVTLLPNDCTPTIYPESSCVIKNCNNEDDTEMVGGTFDGHVVTSTVGEAVTATHYDEDSPMIDSSHEEHEIHKDNYETSAYPDIRITEIKTETVSPDDMGEHDSYFSSQPQQNEQYDQHELSHVTYQQQQRPGRHPTSSTIAFIKTKKEKSSSSPKKHACSLCGKTFARRYLFFILTLILTKINQKINPFWVGRVLRISFPERYLSTIER